MSKKQDTLAAIFEHCLNKGDMNFHNDLTKEICKETKFANPFDVTHIDNSDKLPENMQIRDYFVVNLGKGWHRFVKGINYGYHTFENIDDKIEWKYMKNILDELDTSESNILSVSSNQKILHDFLYDDLRANPNVYNSRRTKMDMKYMIGDSEIVMNKLQMEIDFTFEYRGDVTVFEAKNGFPDDFAVYQLYHPYKYYHEMKKRKNIDVKNVNCCYVLRRFIKGRSVTRFYLYTFDDLLDMTSLKLLKCREYTIQKREIDGQRETEH
jgi:hypothetical protein